MMIMLLIKMPTLLLMLMINYLAVSGSDAERSGPSNPCFVIIMFSSDPADDDTRLMITMLAIVKEKIHTQRQGPDQLDSTI